MLPFRLANVVEIYRKLMDYVQLLVAQCIDNMRNFAADN